MVLHLKILAAFNHVKGISREIIPFKFDSWQINLLFPCLLSFHMLLEPFSLLLVSVAEHSIICTVVIN